MVKKPYISIIVAVDKKNGIGRLGDIPWHISEDMKRFKELTTGHAVIMGRKTFESILKRINKSLPDRVNIVITRNPKFKYPLVKVVGSLKEALQIAKQEITGEIFIIGGGEIYKEAIKIADKIYLTLVEGDFNCDTFFPDYKSFKRKTVVKEGRSNSLKYSFIDLYRH